MQLTSESFYFGPYCLKTGEYTLLCNDVPLAVAPKGFEILALLVENHGRLVSRDTLLQTVWPDSFVEETNVTVNISILRKLLGEMPDGRPYIATIPKRGYRFDGPVTTSSDFQPSMPDILPGVSLTGAAESPHSLLITEEPANVVSPPPAQELTSHPRRTAIVVVSLALLVALASWYTAGRLRQTSSTPASTIRTIAVLPFQTLSSNTAEEYLGLGMTDALISRIGRLQQIVVRPFGAVRRLSSELDPVQTGKTLGVDAVLEGTIRRIGDQTRVNVHLLRVADGRLLWTENFDDQTVNGFALEDSISQKLVQALAVHLSRDEERQFTRIPAPKPEAYALYTQGRYHWNKRSVQDVQQSISLFRQAIAADPSYAAAYSGLADAYVLACSYGISFLAPQVAMPMARESVEKALALDDASPEAHTSLAYIHFTYDWDWPTAEQEFRRAIALSPGYVNAHHWYSHELMALCRVDESIEQSRTALALDPTDPLMNEHIAWHDLFARDYDRAIIQAIKAVELDPSFVQAHRVLGLAHLYTNHLDEACAEFEKGSQPLPQRSCCRCLSRPLLRRISTPIRSPYPPRLP